MDEKQNEKQAEKNWERIYHESWIKSHNVIIEIKNIIDGYSGIEHPKKTIPNQ